MEQKNPLDWKSLFGTAGLLRKLKRLFWVTYVFLTTIPHFLFSQVCNYGGHALPQHKISRTSGENGLPG